MRLLLLTLLISSVLWSCRHDQGPPPVIPEPDNRDRFIGTYSVYDTNNVYLHEMTITAHGSGCNDGNCDSLLIENFADTFTLDILHPRYWQTTHIDIGGHSAIKDYNNKSWFLWPRYAPGDYTKYNHIQNDTIKFYFELDNIAHYINEATPYFRCYCKLVAVKQ